MTSEHLDYPAFPSLGANRHKSPTVRFDGSLNGDWIILGWSQSSGCSSGLQQLRILERKGLSV